jgi:hypothetical protein
MQALLIDGIGQGAYYMLLPHHLAEAFGPPLAREDLVTHGGILPEPPPFDSGGSLLKKRSERVKFAPRSAVVRQVRRASQVQNWPAQ